MKVFLTGSHHIEWRWKIGSFLNDSKIEFFDAVEYPGEFSSIFKLLKTLESCDGVIACFSQSEHQHLQTILELGYASKLAKEILVVDTMRRRKSWIHTLPYSRTFLTLDGLKEHLTKIISIPKKSPRLFG